MTAVEDAPAQAPGDEVHEEHHMTILIRYPAQKQHYLSLHKNLHYEMSP